MSSFLNSSCLNMFLMLCFLSVMTEIYFLKLKGSHFVFSTSGYLIISEYHQYNISGMSVAESVGVVVKHSQLTNLELKISCMVLVDYKLWLLHSSLSRHIGHLDLFCFLLLIAPSYWGKVTIAFPSAPIAVMKWQWKEWSGVLLPLPDH